MRVRIEYTEDVSDDFRRGLRLSRGQTGMATRQEVKDFFWLYGQSMNDDIAVEQDNAYREGYPNEN